MRELPRWAKLTIPWLFIALGFLISWYMISATPATMLLTPSYLLSFVVWIIIALLGGWEFPPIRGRSKRRGRVFGYWPFLVFGTTVLALAQISDLFRTVAYASAGFPSGLSLGLAYPLIWNERLRYCEKCGTYKYFQRRKGSWYCQVCRKKFRTPNIVTPDEGPIAPEGSLATW